jgi:hypothetical protein
MLLYTAMEDAALLTLEMFKKRLVVLNANLKKLEKLTYNVTELRSNKLE